MNLIVFDIDGTLTQTNQVDDCCLLNAFAEERNWSLSKLAWSDFPHATDSCVFEEIFLKETGRKPSLLEITRFQNRFFSSLNSACKQNPSLFSEVPGASSVLKRVAQSQL